MRIAVIGDIHSNIHALVSVLEDIELKKVDFIISTGDLVGYLPFPNEVVDLIREKKILAIQGNHDRNIALSAPLTLEEVEQMSDRDRISSAAAAYTNMAVTDSNREYLKNLPSNLRMAVGDIKLLVIHGSPRRIDEYMYDDPSKLETISNEIDDAVVISGHTHIPYHRIVNAKHFINAGSVGKPKHGNANAIYIVVEIISEAILVEINEVPYDVEKIATVVELSKIFDPKLADMLRKGY